MFSSPALSWLFTVVFAITGLYSLYRFAGLMSGTGRDGDRAAELAHLLMSLAMVGMTWAWTGSADTTGGIVQVVVFGLFALWFAGGLLAGAHRVGGAYHLVMAVAMVWMVVAMPLLMGGMAGGPGDGGRADMPGMQSANPMPTTGALASRPAWVSLVTVVLIVLLAVAALWWLSHLVLARIPVCSDRRRSTNGAGRSARPAPRRLRGVPGLAGAGDDAAPGHAGA
ncbi:MAG TPA: DUF5134 domain-containing protein [Amycolatopsis sp.]|nr:DUF5134 domain-containing protein [Amycolatopsis sp.]